MAWDALESKSEEEQKPAFTQDMAKNLFEASRKSKVKSSICAVVYGHDGTGKTGACMDCRTEKEKKDGKVIVIFDLDDGAGPIKEEYWENDDNIVCLSPVEMADNGDVDYVATYDRLRALVAYVKSIEETEDIKAVILDGLDSLKKLAEWSWKISAGMEPTDKVKQMMDWQHRNWRYNNIIIPLKNMNCDRYFITHLKEIKTFKQVGSQSQLVVDHYEPDWLGGTPGMMYQKVLCEREEDSSGVIHLKARLEKAKHDLRREGKSVELAVINPSTEEVTWSDHAFHDLMVG